MKFLKIIIILSCVLVVVLAIKGPTQDRLSPEYFAWKKQHVSDLDFNQVHQRLILNPDFKFDHLELVEVAPGKKYYSLWGHVMLRFAGSSPLGSDHDLVLSFLADFNDFPVDNLKASTGGYVVMPKIGTVIQYKNEYEKGEGRTIVFHPVNASIEQRQKLLSILRSWIIDPKKPGGYSFFYNNCVSLMSKLLVEAGLLPRMGLYGYWPKYVPRLYAKEGLIHYEQR